MSINVTVSGHPISIRHGRMLLSDLDQIKKNERDRRRRLRLEQVRQQSREISNRLLERAKNVAKQGLEKLEKDDESELKRMHERRIMEIHQKYQEDMEDIGQAHALAALQADVNAQMEAESKKNKAAALIRGREATQQLRDEKKDDPRAVQQERLRRVREMENMRSTLIANLANRTIQKSLNEDNSDSSAEEDSAEVKEIHPKKSNKKKSKKVISARSPRKIVQRSPRNFKHSTKLQRSTSVNKSKEQQASSLTSSHAQIQTEVIVHQDPDYIKHISTSIIDDHMPRKTIPVSSMTPTKADRVARYNPEDYTQEMSDSSSSSSSTSLSDDSSYFSDSAEQQSRCTRTTKPMTTSVDSKVQLYDFNTRQRNAYDRPLGIVERHDVQNEPNAIEAAKEVQRAESFETQIEQNRRRCAQQRGEDALLRERVRRDYQTLIKNLDHLTKEERILTASQTCQPEPDMHIERSSRKCGQEQKERKSNRTRQVLCPSVTVSKSKSPPRQTTRKPVKKDIKDTVSDSRREKVTDYDDQSSVESDQSVEELSREEQILDMLKKVERQKRLLLREFGASLPDDIFNASMRSLLEARTQPQLQPCSIAPTCTVELPKPASPEINVINLSYDEPPKKKTAPVKKQDLKKIEAAVQTLDHDSRSAAEDKSVQVELIQEQPKPVERVTKDIDTGSAPAKHYPIEPKVNIITPEMENSNSSSGSSITTGVVIDINEKEVKVTKKKRKRPVHLSKKPSRSFQKSSSVATSKISTPVKKLSKSLPASNYTSPKKSSKRSSTYGTPKKMVGTNVDEPRISVRLEPTQEAKISVDASTETSQVYSSFEDHDQNASRVYRLQTQSKRIRRTKDTSDTSTSFASPPSVAAGAMLQAVKSETPILELLDSSITESRLYAADISPVSTPGTPSPRTMMMPSNIPHLGRISRLLKFASTDSQTNDSLQPSSTQNDNSTSTDTNANNWKSASVRQHQAPSPRHAPPTAFCTCNNTNCKALHRLRYIESSTLKDCPEILKKYEDLQNMCSERIASLSDLIDKVRNEQRGMELSVIKSEDDTSFMQLPPTISRVTDLNNVGKLVESIKSIQNQLTKTLMETQRLITNESDLTQQAPHEMSVQTPVVIEQIPKKLDTVTQGCTDDEELPNIKGKPRIISEEIVNIKLPRFKINQKVQTTSAATPERSSWPPSKVSAHDDTMIERLSKEILEQTQGLDTISGRSTSLKHLNSSPTKEGKGRSPNDSNKSRRSPSPKAENAKPTVIKKLNTDQGPKRESYIPILAGIPKVSRPLANSTTVNGRAKPPVTLLSGPSRPDIESPGHELSTIMEFDTPDNVSKCQSNAKSPTTKRISFTTDATADSPNSMFKKLAEAQLPKSSISVKPSVHVAPLPTQNVAQQTSDKSSKSPSTKLQEESVISIRAEESVSNPGTETLKKDAHSASEKLTKELQRDVSSQEDPVQGKHQLGTSVSNGSKIESKSHKEKITLTSSNSFSGLSGISEIISTPSSDILKYVSSPEEMETALKKFGLSWAITTLKKTREASALSSSSNSDVTPLNTARRIISPAKKQFDASVRGLPDFSDVSSISIKEASKSTEQAVLLKGRTSTPKMQNSNSNSETSNETTTTSSGTSVQEASDSLTVPNYSLTKTKTSTQDGDKI